MNTEQAIIDATIELFRERGYNGTSLKQIVERSNTTTGSVYHFFPQGKDQLALVAIRRSGPLYQQVIEDLLDGADSLPEGIYEFFKLASAMLEQSNYVDPCPIGGVAREVANVKPPLREATAEVFSAWTNSLAARLRHEGVRKKVALELATTTIAAIEGGFVLARSQRKQNVLLNLGRTFRDLFQSMLDAAN